MTTLEAKNWNEQLEERDGKKTPGKTRRYVVESNRGGNWALTIEQPRFEGMEANRQAEAERR